jgi:hypothetical protein
MGAGAGPAADKRAIADGNILTRRLADIQP